MKKKLRVQFTGEPGIDLGGVSKEWFFLITQRFFNEDYGKLIRDGSLKYSDLYFLQFSHNKRLIDIEAETTLTFYHHVSQVCSLTTASQDNGGSVHRVKKTIKNTTSVEW